MSFTSHLLGLVLALFAVLAPAPLAAVLAGAGRAGGPGLRLVALLAWWIALGVVQVLGLGWCGLLSAATLLATGSGLAVVGLAAWALAAAMRTRLVVDAGAAWERWRTAPARERVALAVLASVAVVWLVALTVVPSDNYDSHMYQLPTVAEWLQHGSVGARSEQWRHAPGYERSMFHYPGAWNAWYALVLGLGGHERWAYLPNLLAWALYGAAVRALARQAGAGATAATLAAALAACVPVAGVALASAHNDLPLAATWLAAVAAAVAAARSGEASWLALTGLLAGMAVGIKPNGLGACACAAAAYAATLARTGRLSAAWAGARRGWPWLAAAALLAALIAVPWYVRNALETGNPLGFMRLHLLGRELPGTIDAAYVAQTTLLHNFHPGDLRHWGWLGASVGVYLGLAWLGLLLPLARWSGWHRGLAGLLALAAVLGWAWIAGPWSAKHAHDETITFWMGQQLRYTFALWGVVAALAAAATRPTSWVERAQVLALWGSVLATIWISAMRPATPLLWVAVTVVFAVLIRRGRGPCRRWLPALALLALAILPWALRDWRQGLRNWYFFGAPSALARLDDGPIAFWGTHQAWLLYGDRLRRHPLWLPLDAAADDAALAAMVRGSGCDHLAIGETWPPTPPAIIDRLLALGVVEQVHGEPHAWGMKIFRIVR
jgi:hypothetical protein